MTTQGQALSMGAIKERMHKVWTSGEYARIGNPLVLIGELLCEAADLRSGDKVLDGRPAAATPPSPPRGASAR